MADFGELLRKPSFLIKILELILALVCVAVHQDSIKMDPVTSATSGLIAEKNKMAFVYMVFCGFALITLMNIIGNFLGRIPKKLATLWAVVGCVLWLAAGGVVLKAYADVERVISSLPPNFKIPPELETRINEELAAGVIGIINGFFYLIEFVLIAKFETEE